MRQDKALCSAWDADAIDPDFGCGELRVQAGIRGLCDDFRVFVKWERLRLQGAEIRKHSPFALSLSGLASLRASLRDSPSHSFCKQACKGPWRDNVRKATCHKRKIPGAFAYICLSV